MRPTLCSRCGKNVAVVFITKIEGGQTKNEGLCLKCAREMHIKPVDDVISKMGLSDDDLESLTGEMMNALNGVEELTPVEDDGQESEDDGKTATFPFLNRLFGGGNNNAESAPPPASDNRRSEGSQQAPKGGKRRFLDNYCIDLTQRAREGKLDRMIGREEELERVIQILNRRQKNNPCLIGEPGVGK
ncbi:MAG: ATP-dependent Clp protease ATP-binding subunit, partial [Oscillospiraceae bacterium]|nr:ATP-dependent Clp protease ATP-binding subunit [Oscillospiraceae bacterium]